MKFISPTKSQSCLLSTTVCYIWQVLLTIFTNKISIKHSIQEIRIYSQRQPLMLAFKAKYLYWRKQYLWQYEHYSPKPRYNNSQRAWTWIWFIPINQNQKGKKIYHSKHILPKKMFIQVKQKQEKVTHQKAAPSLGSFNSTHLGHL